MTHAHSLAGAARAVQAAVVMRPKEKWEQPPAVDEPVPTATPVDQRTPAKLPGPAFWAIVITFVLLLTVTIAGYLHGEKWNAISDMVTRNPRLLNAFALTVGVMTICQAFYVVTMYRRWIRRAALYGHKPVYAPAAPVFIGFLMSVGGSWGFAIVSTNIDEPAHVTYAVVAFTGIYIYLFTFGVLAWYYPNGNGAPGEVHGSALWPHVAAACLAVPFVALLVYGIAHWAGDPISSTYDYVWEFLFVTSMLLAALALYIEDQKGRSPDREHTPVKMGFIKIDAKPHAPARLVF